MSDRRKVANPKSQLFMQDVHRPNTILARTLYNEFLKNGRDRRSILDFINCLLNLVLNESGRGPQGRFTPLVDPKTGFPTSKGFHELVFHELDADNDNDVCAGIALLQLQQDVDLVWATRLVKQALRVGDVVAPLTKCRIGIVVYPRVSADLEVVVQRIQKQLASRVEVQSVASSVIKPGTPPKDFWVELIENLAA